jgi:stearoyl-CoA desaturase (delta-9 desaturase)
MSFFNRICQKLNQLPKKPLVFLIVFTPLVGLIIAINQWSEMQGIDIALFAIMYLLTGLGITVGFHRYFTHHSFQSKPWLRKTFLILGSMAGEGPLTYWVATHRHHHRFTDQEGDPHSPILGKNTLFGKIKGFLHAHMGWLLNSNKPERFHTYAIDIFRDKEILQIDNAYIIWLIAGLLIPAAIGGLWTLSWMGVWMGFIWGGLVRMAVCQHITWGINSVCHIIGKKNHTTQNNSRDNWVLGVLALGEGWHNSHHAFPTSARHGLKWWQFDISFYVIKLLEKLGLVWDVKTPHRNPH